MLGLDLAWLHNHAFDLTALGVGIASLLPTWVFIASEVDISLLGQKVHIKSHDMEEALKGFTRFRVGEVELAPVASAIELQPGLQEPELKAEPTLLGTYLSGFTDPNLALVGLRIEIEKRINLLANIEGIPSNRPLTHTIRELARRETLPPDLAGGLMAFTILGNKAAHGAVIEPNAIDEIRSAQKTVMPALDEVVRRVLSEPRKD